MSHLMDGCSSFVGALSSVWKASSTLRVSAFPFLILSCNDCREKQRSLVFGISQDTGQAVCAVCNTL